MLAGVAEIWVTAMLPSRRDAVLSKLWAWVGTMASDLRNSLKMIVK